MKNFLYDAERIRYRLANSFEGKDFQWLFFPGGPGADSCYFESLIDLLKLPGNVWLIDLPGNGSNMEGIPPNYDFDRWMDLFIPMIKNFDNAILVGQSFGGMLPMLFPELEDHLKGLVILNSAPSLWLQEAVEYSLQFRLPDLTKEMTEFTINPNPQTFEAALDACMPYYFPPSTLELGRKLLKTVPFQYSAAVWWQCKAIELNFNAKWIPQTVPTLIINSTHDCICPYTLYQRDARFDRPNIEKIVIQEAGHLPWLEKPEAVREAFLKFVQSLTEKNAQ